MSSLRTTSFSIDHVIAEVAAAPLASEAALRYAITFLDPRFRDAGSRAVWRATERATVAGAQSLSIDEITAIRDRVWFGDLSRGTRPLGDYLRRLAHKFLEARGPAAVPRIPSEEGRPTQAPHEPRPLRARRSWRWITFALPSDLLVAALDGGDDGALEVDAVSPPLRRLLRERGYAETHLHLGAALDFSTFWVGLMLGMGQRGFRPAAFESPGAQLGEGRRFAGWVLRAAIVRCLLAAFLSRRGNTGAGLPAYLRDVEERVCERLGGTRRVLLRACLRDLIRGRMSTRRRARFAELRDLYRSIGGIGGSTSALGFEQVDDSDPIARFLGSKGTTGIRAEMRLVRAGLAYDATGGRRDELFARLFWQCIRLRCMVYRHVVQRPLTPGLQWFIRTYGRLAAGRHSFTPRLQLESARALSGGAEGGLGSLEVRTSPDRRAGSIRRFVEEVWTASDGSEVETGVVFHFTRHRRGGARRGIPAAHSLGSHADPGSRGNLRSRCRFAGFFNRKQREALSLARLLIQFPASLELIRGVDVCSDELGVPTWVMVPLMQQIRRAAALAEGDLRRQRRRRLPALGVTAHAGEDFVHLLGGLRRIDEALSYFELREGDRLGHAVALGIHARQWARRAGAIAIAREERLWDLVWEWEGYTREGVRGSPSRPAWVEREIGRLAEAVFGRIPGPGGPEPPPSPGELAQLMLHLGTVRSLRRIGFPNTVGWSPRPHGRARRLMALYLVDRGIFRRGQEIEWVDPGDAAESLEALQEYLRFKVADRGITVEINPSSNLLIGNLADLENHPLWRLNPPDGGDAKPVAVCIGSDDPLTFAASLPQEYMLVQDALIAGGLSSDKALQWVDGVRATGLNTRFTVRRSRRPRAARAATTEPRAGAPSQAMRAAYDTSRASRLLAECLF